jgi:hypothetical protein
VKRPVSPSATCVSPSWPGETSVSLGGTPASPTGGKNFFTSGNGSISCCGRAHRPASNRPSRRFTRPVCPSLCLHAFFVQETTRVPYPLLRVMVKRDPENRPRRPPFHVHRRSHPCCEYHPNMQASWASLVAYLHKKLIAVSLRSIAMSWSSIDTSTFTTSSRTGTLTRCAPRASRPSICSQTRPSTGSSRRYVTKRLTRRSHVHTLTLVRTRYPSRRRSSEERSDPKSVEEILCGGSSSLSSVFFSTSQ